MLALRPRDDGARFSALEDRIKGRIIAGVQRTAGRKASGSADHGRHQPQS